MTASDDLKAALRDADIPYPNLIERFVTSHPALILALLSESRADDTCMNCGMSDATCRSIHAKTDDYCCDLCETAFVHFDTESTHGNPTGATK